MSIYLLMGRTASADRRGLCRDFPAERPCPASTSCRGTCCSCPVAQHPRDQNKGSHRWRLSSALNRPAISNGSLGNRAFHKCAPSQEYNVSAERAAKAANHNLPRDTYALLFEVPIVGFFPVVHVHQSVLSHKHSFTINFCSVFES